VEGELRAAASRGVEVKIIMMSSKRLSEEDRRRRDEMIRRLNEALDGRAEIRVADEVVMRGCIIDAEVGGRALFLVEEVGVPFFLREAAITSHPSVVRGLATLFDLMWRYGCRKPFHYKWLPLIALERRHALLSQMRRETPGGCEILHQMWI